MRGKPKRMRILVFLAGFLVGITLMVGCSGKSEEAGVPSKNQYVEAGGGVTFDYPGRWVTTSASSQYAIVSLADPQAKAVSITVEKRAMPTGYTLKRFNDELVTSMNPAQVLSGTFPTIAGVSACETVFKADDSQVRIVNLEKNDTMYTILCRAPAAAFDSVQTAFNTVINSFKVP